MAITLRSLPPSIAHNPKRPKEKLTSSLRQATELVPNLRRAKRRRACKNSDVVPDGGRQLEQLVEKLGTVACSKPKAETRDDVMLCHMMREKTSMTTVNKRLETGRTQKNARRTTTGATGKQKRRQIRIISMSQARPIRLGHLLPSTFIPTLQRNTTVTAPQNLLDEAHLQWQGSLAEPPLSSG